MNISCPNCHTVFRVDPARVPATGIKARCSRCGSTFPVRRPEPEPAAAQVTAPEPIAENAAVAAGTGAEPSHASESEGTGAGAVEGGAAPSATEAAPAPPEPMPTPVAASEPASAEPEATSDGASAAAAVSAPEPERPHTFGSRDPQVRATRIARALVSDIIAYHPQRWESSRAAGTLRTDFRDEIMKSWEEYVAQVGLELAKSTPHFRSALNDILAGGQQLF